MKQAFIKFCLGVGIVACLVLVLAPVASAVSSIKAAPNQNNVPTDFGNAGNFNPDFTSPQGDQQPAIVPDQYYRAVVEKILEEGTFNLGGAYKQPYQKVRVKLLTGPQAGQEVDIDYGKDSEIRESQKVKVGDTIVVLQSHALEGATQYFIADRYRLPAVLVMVAIFLLVTVFFGRLKGLTSILGLALSIGVLIWFVIPRIVAGANPLWTCVLGAIMIVLVSLYLAHGFNKRTSIALLSTLLTLGVSVGLASLAVQFAKLSGMGSEDAFYLQTDFLHGLDLRGLLLGGIIIGALGVLDDVTTGQAAAVDEIHNADPKLPFTELYKRGLSVGKEHIASLVNTLALAYVGASFPLLLLFATNHDQPLWFVVNGELVMEEVVRTLVGSMALLIAVPLTTLLTARFLVPRAERRKRVLP